MVMVAVTIVVMVVLDISLFKMVEVLMVAMEEVGMLTILGAKMVATMVASQGNRPKPLW